MTNPSDCHLLEDRIAKLRLLVVVLTGLALGLAEAASVFAALWLAAAAYASAVLLLEPHRHLWTPLWQIGISAIDWALITAAVFVTGNGSELYALYFLFVITLALRFDSLGAAIAGIATATAYAATSVFLDGGVDANLATIGLRAGYIVCTAVGSGVVAAEIRRQIRARSTAEAGRSAAQDITAAISHDLLNPISSILGLIEDMQDSPDEPLTRAQQKTLVRVTSNARRMTALVRNLLDSEALERGTPSLLLRPADVNALIDRCADANAGDTAAKKLAVEIDLDPNLPRAVVDELLIERLVTNLLHNAIKFTPEGGQVRLSTRCRRGSFRIEVWNSGPPVPADLEPAIFEKHTRTPGSSGVGLGLYICKLATRLHGGVIGVQHPDSGGVTFVVDLPLRTAAEAVPPRQCPAPVFAQRPAPAI